MMRRSGSILQVGLNALKKRDGKRLPVSLNSTITRSSSCSTAGAVQRHSDGSLLSTKVKNSGHGSKMGIGYSDQNSKSLPSTPVSSTASTGDETRSDSVTETILARVQKDNKRLLKELEQTEAQAKEAEELMVLCDELKETLTKLKKEKVSSEQYTVLSTMVKDEKAAVAVLECKREGLETDLKRLQKKQKKGKFFKK